MHRGANAGGAVRQNLGMEPGGQALEQLGELRLDCVGGLDDVGAGLALDVEDDRRRAVGQRPQSRILRAFHNLCHILETDGRVVLIADDQVLIVLDRLQLIIGVDLVGAVRAVETALRRIGIRIVDRGAQLREAEAVARQCLRVGADAHRRLLPAREPDETDAADLADLLGEARVDDRLHLRQRHRVGRDRDRHDRRVGRVDLGINRRRRQIGR